MSDFVRTSMYLVFLPSIKTLSYFLYVMSVSVGFALNIAEIFQALSQSGRHIGLSNVRHVIQLPIYLRLHDDLFVVLCWAEGFALILKERRRQLPIIPTRGHGFALILLWVLAFAAANLPFISWINHQWWWYLSGYAIASVYIVDPLKT